NWVISPRFERVRDCSEDRVAFLAGGKGAHAKWGCADRKGDVVIPPRFARVDDFAENVAYVSVEGRGVFVDREGAIVLEVPQNLSLSSKYGTAHPIRFRSGYSRIYGGLHGYVGFMNREGKVAIELSFREATEFDGDVAVVSDKLGEYVLIDSTGRSLYDTRY